MYFICYYNGADVKMKALVSNSLFSLKNLSGWVKSHSVAYINVIVFMTIFCVAA